MQFTVTFRHMEATEALKAYAKDRLSCVRKYFPDPISCHVVLYTERHHHTSAARGAPSGGPHFAQTRPVIERRTSCSSR